MKKRSDACNLSPIYDMYSRISVNTGTAKQKITTFINSFDITIKISLETLTLTFILKIDNSEPFVPVSQQNIVWGGWGDNKNPKWWGQGGHVV